MPKKKIPNAVLGAENLSLFGLTGWYPQPQETEWKAILDETKLNDAFAEGWQFQQCLTITRGQNSWGGLVAGAAGTVTTPVFILTRVKKTA